MLEGYNIFERDGGNLPWVIYDLQQYSKVVRRIGEVKAMAAVKSIGMCETTRGKLFEENWRIDGEEPRMYSKQDAFADDDNVSIVQVKFLVLRHVVYIARFLILRCCVICGRSV